MNCGHSLDIDREDWENRYGFFSFDLTTAGSGHQNNCLVPRRTGNINLYRKFHTPTPADINFNCVRRVPESVGN